MNGLTKISRNKSKDRLRQVKVKMQSKNLWNTAVLAGKFLTIHAYLKKFS